MKNLMSLLMVYSFWSCAEGQNHRATTESSLREASSSGDSVKCSYIATEFSAQEKVCYEDQNGLALMGDMILGTSEEMRQRAEEVEKGFGLASVSSFAARWPNATMYYKLDSTLFPENVTAVRRYLNGTTATQVFNKMTILGQAMQNAQSQFQALGIKLLPCTPQICGAQSKFIDVVPEPNALNCGSSFVGYLGQAAQPFYINVSNSSCIDYPDSGAVNAKYLQYVVLHELMHALGVVHEHQRSDRDTSIRIMDGCDGQRSLDGALKCIDGRAYNSVNDHMMPSAVPAFIKLNIFDTQALGGYDLASVMHYSRLLGSKDNKATMELPVAQGGGAFPATTLIGGITMSASDKAGLQKLYSLPTPPSDFKVQNATSSSITFRFKDNATNETGYSIFFKNVPTNGSTVDWPASPQVTLGAQTNNAQTADIVLSGLQANTLYDIKIVAFYNHPSLGTLTSALVAQAITSQALPVAPTLTSVVALPNPPVAGRFDYQLRVSYRDNSTNETGFNVRVATSEQSVASAKAQYTESTSPTTTGARAINISVPQAGIKYFVRVGAVKSGVPGEFASAILSVTAPSIGGPVVATPKATPGQPGPINTTQPTAPSLKDNFDRADGALGSNWNIVNAASGGMIKVISQRAQAMSTYDPLAIAQTVNLGNSEISANYLMGSSGSNYIALFLRASGYESGLTQMKAYRASIYDDGIKRKMILQKTGSTANLKEVDLGEEGIEGKLSFKISGNVITVMLGGVTKITYTDPSPLPSGRAGIQMTFGSTFDNVDVH